jgi:hypothetical protein
MEKTMKYILKIKDELGLTFTESFETEEMVMARANEWLGWVDETPLESLTVLEGGEILKSWVFTD